MMDVEKCDTALYDIRNPFYALYQDGWAKRSARSASVIGKSSKRLTLLSLESAVEGSEDNS